MVFLWVRCIGGARGAAVVMWRSFRQLHYPITHYPSPTPPHQLHHPSSIIHRLHHPIIHHPSPTPPHQLHHPSSITSSAPSSHQLHHPRHRNTHNAAEARTGAAHPLLCSVLFGLPSFQIPDAGFEVGVCFFHLGERQADPLDVLVHLDYFCGCFGFCVCFGLHFGWISPGVLYLVYGGLRG